MTAMKYAVTYAVSVLVAFVLGKVYGKATEQAAVAELIRGWKYTTNGASLAYAEIKARVKHLI